MRSGFSGFFDNESLWGIHALGLSYFEVQNYTNACVCLQVPLLSTDFKWGENFLKGIQRKQTLGMIGSSFVEQGLDQFALPYLNQVITCKLHKWNDLSQDELELQDRIHVNAFCNLGRVHFRLGDFKTAYE